MLQNWLYLLLAVGAVLCYPNYFETKNFKVGIEYDHSRPMKGGSDRYRHRNNYDPFFVTITAEARKGYVITYLEVTGTIDEGGELHFNVIKGSTGSTTMVFQLVSNRTDFLSFSYMTYGIKEEEYNKLANVITVPMTNDGIRLSHSGITVTAVIFSLLYAYFFKCI